MAPFADSHRSQIWLTVRRQDRDAEIRVNDTGFGIDPELLPHIFDLFTQAERSLDRAQGGLGIGLAPWCGISSRCTRAG